MPRFRGADAAPVSKAFTYQARLIVDPAIDAALNAYARLYGYVERCLFAATARGDDPDKVKPAFSRQHGLTARQYNAVSVGLKGKLASIKQRRASLIEEAAERIKKAREVIKKLGKKTRQPKVPKGVKPDLDAVVRDRAAYRAAETKRLFALHHKKRRLGMLGARHATLVADDAAGVIRIAFGSRKLFRAQFDLAANGYASHADWRQDWQAARSSQFMVLGSKDETAGCQGCVVTIAPNNTLSMQLRLPDALAEHGKYVTLQGVRFHYGATNIMAALRSSTVSISKDAQGKTVRKRTGTALSYRFVKQGSFWTVFVTVMIAPPPVVTDLRLGAIGIDFNADHLALAELDRSGNMVDFLRLQTTVRGQRSDQREAIFGEAAAEIADRAKRAGKPVVLEALDFSARKTALEAVNHRQSRMLSALAYRQAGAMIRAACFRAGVEVIEINPAYTSVQGAVIHAQVRGVSVHIGAAWAVARRGSGFTERTPRSTAIIPVRNGGHLTLDLPERNRARHVWSYWANVRRKLIAAHVAHFRSGGGKKPPAPLSSLPQTVCSYRHLQVRPLQANCPGDRNPDVWTDVPF